MRLAEKLLYASTIAIVLVTYALLYLARPVPQPKRVPQTPTQVPIPKPQPASESHSMASTNWQALTTYASVGGVFPFVNPENAAANDGSNTTQFIELDSQGGAYLACTGLTEQVPGGAIIDGIEIRYEVSKSGNSTQLKEDFIYVILGGTPTGNNLADIVTAITATPTLRTRGGASELAGLTPTYTQVNASDFGVALYFKEDNDDDGTVEIDYVEMRIHYTPVVVDFTGGVTLPGFDASGEDKGISTGGATLPGFNSKVYMIEN